VNNISPKTALIAGINNEAGAAAAYRLKASGWTVIGTDIVAAEDLNRKELDGYFSLDMTKRTSFLDIASEVEREYGPVKALFCATGFEAGRQSRSFSDTSMEQWQRTLEGWLKSSINACAAVAPYMIGRKEGRIIILSPDYSKVAQENILNAAAAGTLHGFAKSFGVESAKENVLVNCIFANLPFDTEAIAAAVHFLAESGNYVSAQVISIHGKEKGGAEE
jgi:NAD(P)-dependent dehydrogenase (short-subunit alcohol dehydrogenase family)